MAEGDKIIRGPGQQRQFISEQEIETLLRAGRLSDKLKQALREAGSESVVLGKTFTELSKLLETIRSTSEEFVDDLSSISSQLRDNLNFLKGSNALYNETASISRQLLSQSEKIKEIRVSGAVLDEKSFTTEKTKLDLSRSRLESLKERLRLTGSEEERESLRVQAERASREFSIQKKLQRLAETKEEKYLAGQRAESARNEIRQAKSKLAILEDISKARLLEIALVREMNESEGAKARAKTFTGNIVLKTKLLNKVGLTDIADQLQSASDAATSKVKSTYSVTGDWEKATVAGEVMYNRLKPKFTDLGKALKNVALSWILTNIVHQFNQVDDVAARLKQNIGTWEHSAAAANLQFATSKDYLQAALDIAEKFYINPAVVFTSEELGKVAEAKNLLGLSDIEASNLAMYTKAAGVSAERYKDGIEAGFRSYSAVNRTAVNHGQVLRETLRTSDAIRLSVGGTGKGLAEAAAAALSIGMNLEQVQKIAQSLINFESSIESEMTAQLLTGQQINLTKARELALNNDLEGVVGEISRQGVDMVKFGSWNYIQQENFAKALGMSREELAKMLVLQGIQRNLSEEQIAANMRISKEEIHAMSTAQEWKTATDKLVQSVAPLVKIFATVVDLVSALITKVAGVTGWVASLFGASEKVSNSISKFTNSLILGLIMALPLTTKITKGLSNIGGAFAAGVGMLRKGFRGKGSEVAPAITKSVSTTGSAAEKVKGRGSNLPSLGKGIAGFFRPFKTITPAMIGKATLAALALVPVALSSPAIALAGGVGHIASKGLPLLGKSITGFFRPFRTVTPDMLGKATLAALALVPVALSSPAIALASGTGYVASKGLPLLGKGIAGFFRAIGKIPAQALLIGGVITLAAIGIGFALKLMAPALEAIGNILGKVLKGIGDVVVSIGTAISTVITSIAGLSKSISLESVAAIAALGGAFVALAGGLAALTIPLTLFPLGKLTSLFTAIQNLRQTPVAISTAPTGQITAAETRAQAAQTTTGTVETQKTEKTEVDLSRIEGMLTQLIGAVKEGKNIYLNGDKVSQTLAYSTSKA